MSGKSRPTRKERSVSARRLLVAALLHFSQLILGFSNALFGRPDPTDQRNIDTYPAFGVEQIFCLAKGELGGPERLASLPILKAENAVLGSCHVT